MPSFSPPTSSPKETDWYFLPFQLKVLTLSSKRDRYPLIIKNILLHLTTLECLDTWLLLGNTYSPWKTSFVVKNVYLTNNVVHVNILTRIVNPLQIIVLQYCKYKRITIKINKLICSTRYIYDLGSIFCILSTKYLEILK